MSESTPGGPGSGPGTGSPGTGGAGTGSAGSSDAGGGRQSGASSGQGSTWYEEFKVSGDNLVAKVRELIREGNVRRVFIKNESGQTLLEIPLTAGVAVTVLTAAVAPVLVAVGAVAALLTQVTVGVERRTGPDAQEPGAESTGGAGRHGEPPAPPEISAGPGPAGH